MALSFSGSTWASTSDRCWNSVLNSTVTLLAATVAPGFSDSADGSSGTVKFTYLAPNTVVERMSTPALAGTSFS